MSRIESGKMTIEEALVHLPEVIRDIRAIIQANVSAKGQNLCIEVEDVVSEDIYTDKLRLNQVLLNILSNAIKFTPEGGSIWFHLKEEPSQEEGIALFEIKIRDNGIGMSQEFQKNIFEAFTRERSSTVSGIQGTGLGMAITRSIVDMMGGSISVKSKEGEGTEFTLNLPCRVQRKELEPLDIPELRNVRVLIADPDISLCSSMAPLLTQLGMRSEERGSAKEALDLTQQALDKKDPFGLFIIDWRMPDMKGEDFVRNLRSLSGEEVPIITLSSCDWSDIEKEAKEAGVTAYCEKPLFMSDLRRVLKEPFALRQEKKKKSDIVSFEGKRILLAEDNEMNQIIVVAILSETHASIEIAGDGLRAVAMMKEAPAGYYDLILMDIEMPGLNGYDAARQIRALEDPIKAQIPIVAVTANAFEEDRKAALGMGMNAHLAKPYDIPQMLGTLGEILLKEKR